MPGSHQAKPPVENADENFGERSLRRTDAIAALNNALELDSVPVALLGLPPCLLRH